MKKIYGYIVFGAIIDKDKEKARRDKLSMLKNAE
jgi:hypothetical protein